MKNKINIVSISIAVLVSLLLFFIINFLAPNDKIAYVRTGLLIQDYSGMKEVNAVIENDMKGYKAVIDSLQLKQQVLSDLHAKASGGQKLAYKTQLSMIEKEFEIITNNASAQLEKKKNDLTNNVLQEVNIQIARYAKKHGYKLILGSTVDGSILYGDEAIDVTEDLVKELNEIYAKEK